MRSGELVLLTCSGLLLAGGAILGASTAWGLCKISYYFWTSDLGLEVGGSIMTVTAAILCLPASWLATVVPYNPRAYALHGTLMCLLLAAMVLMTSGLQSTSDLSRALRGPAALNASMLRALARAPSDGSVRQAFDAMQLELKCCGVQSFQDWAKINSNVPAACCGNFLKKHGEVCSNPMYQAGCLCPALQELRYYCNSMSTLSYSLILVLAATLFATAYLLAATVLEHAERLKPQQIRIACLTGLPSYPPVTSSLPPPVIAPAPAL